jgi:hypothetical protein
MTPERLHELLNYDPKTGLFTWAKARRRCRLGSVVGCQMKSGYISIRLDNELFYAHRLAWLYVYGKWPTDQIDHIDGKRDNNKVCNLREVSNLENAQNIRGPKAKNSSGFLGVRKENSKWLAEIKVNYKPIRIGLFATPEEAHEAYILTKRRLHAKNTL